MITLEVTADCEYGGYSITVAFSVDVPGTSTWSLYREDDTGPSVVRGAKDIPVSETVIQTFIDYEGPISETVKYTVIVSDYGQETVFVPPLMTLCGVGQYLRDLLDPDVHFTSGFCLGQIEQFESNVRSGIFPVLGRPAPIAVVDTRETETGTLKFVSRTQDELTELKRIFSRGTPMLLQVESEYNIGRSGVLYFQPQKFIDRWLMPNAKDPRHVIEVSFTVIDAPSYTNVSRRRGIPYDIPDVTPPGYLIETGELAGRSYCDGGLLQQYASYTDLFNSGKTYAEVYYTQDSCADAGVG